MRVINNIFTCFYNFGYNQNENMTELEEYKHCLAEIERYRCMREQILKDIAELTEKLSAAQAESNREQVTTIQKLINAKYLQDEEYGAKMHELAIRRNLLEP